MLSALTAISPIDGRYSNITRHLSEDFSEYGLIYARVWVEIDYLLALPSVIGDRMPAITDEESERIRSLLENFYDKRAEEVKDIETKGDPALGRKPTRHDVKAVEIWLGDRLREMGLEKLIPWIHFGLTSMDVDNLAYGIMLQFGLANTMMPALQNIDKKLRAMISLHAALAMLARTHGQGASPTTLGKEIAVFQWRLARQVRQLERFELLMKFSGASGNWNAHVAAFPNVDWMAFSMKFVESFNTTGPGIRFVLNPLTTQIEPHDTYAELFNIFMRINTIFIDFSQDMWRYISDDWLVQTPVPGEVGSSTMPQKINPIDFENAEGNLEFAYDILASFCRKLPRSRLQRDLSDSTVMRNFGVAFGHCLIGYHNVVEGLSKVSANETKIREALDAHPEVIAEAYQTILRREGMADAYDTLKEFTRGKPMTLELLLAFVDSLPISVSAKFDMEGITPYNYTGLAEKLARSI